MYRLAVPNHQAADRYRAASKGKLIYTQQLKQILNLGSVCSVSPGRFLFLEDRSMVQNFLWAFDRRQRGCFLLLYILRETRLDLVDRSSTLLIILRIEVKEEPSMNNDHPG